ncbi:hypothetical protein VTI74DRAFT_2009 [Chaetomium olivicolor]
MASAPKLGGRLVAVQDAFSRSSTALIAVGPGPMPPEVTLSPGRNVVIAKASFPS